MWEPFFDFVFGIRWWHWLVGTAGVAGLYYLVAGVILPYLKGVQQGIGEEHERKHQEEEEQEKRKVRAEREDERRTYLKTIPSGPVGPVDLPRATLRIRNKSWRLPQDAEVTFGTRRGVTVPVMQRGVSREHAKIRPEPRGYVLYDLMSEAGTFVGSQRIASKVLADGDRIRIGGVEVIFHRGQAPRDD